MPRCALRWLAWLLLGFGVLGIAGVALREAQTWLPEATAEMRQYFPQRILFALGMLTELPLVQSLVLGLGCCVVNWRNRRRSDLALARRAKTVRVDT